MNYREMTIEDYPHLIDLWSQVEGVRLRDADSKEGITKYLCRNPGLSFVAEHDGKIIGTIMGGHDGKRGYVQHLAVAEVHRLSGIGSKLATMCLEALKREGILKTHLMVLENNSAAKQFWLKLGWKPRGDIELYSFINSSSQNV